MQAPREMPHFLPNLQCGRAVLPGAQPRASRRPRSRRACESPYSSALRRRRSSAALPRPGNCVSRRALVRALINQDPSLCSARSGTATVRQTGPLGWAKSITAPKACSWWPQRLLVVDPSGTLALAWVAAPFNTAADVGLQTRVVTRSANACPVSSGCGGSPWAARWRPGRVSLERRFRGRQPGPSVVGPEPR